MEGSVEQPPEPDKEGLCRAMGRALAEGYAMSGAEFLSLAASYAVNANTANYLMNSRMSTQIMAESGVSPTRVEHKGAKIWVDSNGHTNPADLAATKDALDAKRKAAATR